MNKESGRSDHLMRNLDRIYHENSIFNYKAGRKAFPPLGQGNINKWLEKFLPNTRIIIEPKIIGPSIGIQYIDGQLKKAINENSEDITKSVMSQKNIPKMLSLRKRIEIQGVLYKDKSTSNKHINNRFSRVKDSKINIRNPRFCAFKIFNCNINHFQSLQELKLLGFEIPQTQFTNFISDIEIYLQCWKDGKLFKNYPTNGIVLKINSRKLQKYLKENNPSVNWAYALN